MNKTVRNKKRAAKMLLVLCMVIGVAMLTGCSSASATGNSTIASVLGGESSTVKIMLLMTVLTLLPSILIMLTGFTRIIIVLSLVRNGLGLQQMPPNQVLIGLALFLTFFTMTPVFSAINTNAYQPYVNKTITEEQAVTEAMKPIREFMLKQTYKSDLDFFVSIAKTDQGATTIENIPTSTLIPAFITSEIKRGFQIGLYIYVPFIVIDMIVASTLMSMGMMMLPPTVISLPFKLLLFVLVNGWTLTVKTLLMSFG